MGHFQTKKPRDKARREFRYWRMSPAGHWGALPYETGFGKIETRIAVSLSMEKNAVYARFWEFSSRTSVLDSLNLSFRDFLSRFIVSQVSPKFSGRLGLWKFECDDRIR